MPGVILNLPPKKDSKPSAQIKRVLVGINLDVNWETGEVVKVSGWVKDPTAAFKGKAKKKPKAQKTEFKLGLEQVEK